MDRLGTFAAGSVLYREEPHALLRGERLTLFRREAERVQSELDRLFAGPSPPRFLHLDVYLGNGKLIGNRLAVLDFDDSMWAFPAQDIAISFFYLHYLRGFPEDLWLAFERGYRRIREWPMEGNEQLSLLLEARALDLLDVLVNDDRAQVQARLPELMQAVEDQIRELSSRRG